MFDWIKQLILEFWAHVWPFRIIEKFERGALLTWGKNPKELLPGFHWFVLPFSKQLYRVIITKDTLETKPVHVTTQDHKTITVTPIIEFIIIDPIKWAIDTHDAKTNLVDLTRGAVADYITDINWEECKKKTTCTQIKNKLNDIVSDMGAKVTRLVLADICISRVIITRI